MNPEKKSLFLSIILFGCISSFLWFFFHKNITPELSVDFMKSEHPFHVAYEGIGPIEKKEGYRWAFGPSSTITFILSENRELLLTFQLSNPIPGQTLTVTANDRIIKSYDAIPTQTDFKPWNSTRIKISGRRGINTISFSFGAWNQHGFIVDNNDTRAFAMALKELTLVTP